MYTQDLEAGLVMFMVDNCHNLLNLGHKLAHLSHMNMEKFNPLTYSFSLQYHPWVTHKGHEKKGNDHQQKKLLIFKPILLVNICLTKDKLEDFLAKVFKICKCDAVLLWRLPTHGNEMIKSWINRQSTHHKSNLFLQCKIMTLFFLMLKSRILFRGS